MGYSGLEVGVYNVAVETNLGKTEIYFVDGARREPEAGGNGAGVTLVVVEHHCVAVLRFPFCQLTEN